MPANGRGVGAVFLIGALFLVAGIGYGIAMARLARKHAATGQAHTAHTRNRKRRARRGRRRFVDRVFLRVRESRGDTSGGCA